MHIPITSFSAKFGALPPGLPLRDAQGEEKSIRYWC